MKTRIIIFEKKSIDIEKEVEAFEQMADSYMKEAMGKYRFLM